VKHAVPIVLALAGAAHADEAVRRLEAERARLLDHAPPLARSDDARHKADDTGDYDLTRVAITLDGGDVVAMPAEARFDVTLTAMRPLDGAVVLLAADFEPDAVRDADGNPLRFRHDPSSGELLISLPMPVGPGRELTLSIDAPFTPACARASGCITGAALRHVVEYGWYPLDAQFPTTDRFDLEMTISVAAGDVPSAAGQKLSDAANDGRRVARFRSEQPTTLAAFEIGPYTLRAADGGPAPIELYAPPAAARRGAPLGQLAADALRYHQTLYGPYPFDRLALTGIDDAANVGLGTQADVLLREQEWATVEDPQRADLVRRVASHEIAHQWFANLVAVAESRELWLSEAFAEFAATRYSERVTGTDDHARTNYWAYVQGVQPLGDVPLWSDELPDGPYRFTIGYQKGSYVLQMLRKKLGDRVFDETMSAYVRAFAGQIVTTPELVDFWEETSGVPLRDFFDRWVFHAGFPILHVQATPARGPNDPVVVRLTVDDQGKGAFTGPLPLRLHRGDGSSDDVTATLERTGDQRFSAGPVQWVEVDPDLTIFRHVRPDPSADVDLSGVVDGLDLLDVTAAQGREAPDPHWDDRVDTNGDDVIDAHDVAAVRDQFGRGW
jgi:aminopeptidase N